MRCLPLPTPSTTPPPTPTPPPMPPHYARTLLGTLCTFIPRRLVTLLYNVAESSLHTMIEEFSEFRMIS